MGVKKHNTISEVYTFDEKSYSVISSAQLESLSEEEKSVVDGEHIIGRVVGPMFVPDGASRNGRWYPKELWEKVINDDELKARMAGKLVYGTIGHDEEPFTDEDLRNGKGSHITTKLWIDDETGLGMGEALILNSPVGKNLLTALKIGSKLSVSSRAFGEYKANEYHDGLPVVDADTYQFHCFDFVLDPGFLQARPTLKEKMESEISKEKIMSNEQNITSEAIAGLRDMNKGLTQRVTSLIKENADLKNAHKSLREHAQNIINQYKTILGNHKVVQEALRESKKKSVADFIAEVKTPSVKAILDFISGKNLKLETLKGIEELVSSSKNEGKASLANAHRILKVKLENKDKTIDKAKNIIEAYRSFGTLEEIDAARQILERYTKIGSIPDILGVMSLCQEKLRTASKAKLSRVVEDLAKQSGLEVEKVASLIKKMGISEAKSILASFSKKPITEAKQKVIGGIKVVEKKDNNDDEGEAALSFFESIKVGKNQVVAKPVSEAVCDDDEDGSYAESYFKSIRK